MLEQLRIYRIEPSLREQFSARFKNHAMRIMEKYGFSITHMWFSESDQGLEFIYILEWPDQQTLASGWEAFMADPEWADIKQRSRDQYGEMVLAKVRDQIILPATFER